MAAIGTPSLGIDFDLRHFGLLLRVVIRNRNRVGSGAPACKAAVSMNQA
jgi:hypothetical protein